jgi:hypothetical protein
MSRQEDRSKETIPSAVSLPTADVEGSAKTLNPSTALRDHQKPVPLRARTAIFANPGTA